MQSNETLDGKIEVSGPNQYRNSLKAVEIGNAFWNETASNGLADIVADRQLNGKLVTRDGHEFVNFSCCSYLDLDSHPLVIAEAIAAVRKYGVLDHCISRIRVQLPALLELEDKLSGLFKAKTITAISASAVTAGVLPLIASGLLTKGTKPAMVFDKHCHFSMSLLKPVCGDETLVLTCPHNDLDFIEDACRKYRKVAYIADGTYSMGGHARVTELLELQDRYGIFLYFDDSHSVSIYGAGGEGFIRSQMTTINAETLITVTLNKAFGTSGGALMLGPTTQEIDKIIARFGGPLAWSQPMNTAAIGASLGSVQVHQSPELLKRQKRLLSNIRLFDSLITTPQSGLPFPIKLVKLKDDHAIECGKKLYEAGIYVSPVFFPIVSRGEAGLRVMLRAGHSTDEIIKASNIIRTYI